MMVYELETVGIPECCMSFGIFSTKEKAEAEFKKIESRLKNEDEGYGQDYILIIKERVLK